MRDVNYKKDCVIKVSRGTRSGIGEWWSVLQLTLAAILVAINGMAEPSRRWKPYKFVFAGLFVFLSHR